MASNSRYDFMSNGVVADSETGSIYPVPLSLSYLIFKMTAEPKEDIMTNSKISFFWHEAEACYGSPCWDDVVLTLNGVAHKNFMKQGDKIYFPDLSDIKTSFMKERS